MSDVEDASSGPEPSMEEILASIRRIIADEKDPSESAAEDMTPQEDVIELTQEIQEDGSVGEVDLAESEPEPIPEPEPEFDPVPIPKPEIEPEPVIQEFSPVLEDQLVSEDAAGAAASSLSALAHTVEIERKAAGHVLSPLGNGARTLEDMTMELMKPLLKAWLDENLPLLVDRAVQKEVERIARRVQE